jgi:hypothetical protein
MEFRVYVLAEAFTKSTITLKSKKHLDEQYIIYLSASRNIWGYMVFNG